MNLQVFIERANIIHNNKYDYSKSKYINAKTKIIIICPIHGEFNQTPASHLQGIGCRLCGIERSRMKRSLTLEQFIEKANIIHNNKYDYSKVNYVHSRLKVIIICPIHGEFNKIPNDHLSAVAGCPVCAKINFNYNNLTTEEFIKRSIEIHKELYDYSLVEYINMNLKVNIICKIHNDIFRQRPNDHIHGKNGCPLCGRNKVAIILQLTKEEFIKRSIEIQEIHYDYSLVDYVNIYTPVKIICPKHGIFLQEPNNHVYKGIGCPSCSTRISKGQLEIYNFILQYNKTAILEHELSDIYIPDKNLVIEYNGVYWHSINNNKDLSHLKNKMIKLNNKGLRVINIYEDEWQNSRSHIEQIIKNALGVIKTKIMARKCLIRIDYFDEMRFKDEIIPFFNNNHHQGYSKTRKGISYSLIYNEDIVASAFFGPNEYKNIKCELIRFTTKSDIKVVGGLSKILTNFLKDNQRLESIESFCDLRLFTGEGYFQCGFIQKNNISIGFNVVVPHKGLTRYNRLKISKNSLKQYFTEDELNLYSQFELAKKLNWFVVPDCGQLSLILKNKFYK